jgi:hypothetical protein
MITVNFGVTLRKYEEGSIYNPFNLYARLNCLPTEGIREYGELTRQCLYACMP